MTLDQVKQIIGPSFTFQDYGKSDDSAEQHWVAVKPFEGYAILILNNKLIYLDHYQSFPEEKRPALDKTIHALREKYGSPSLVYADPASIFWLYDAQWSLIHNIPAMQENGLMVCIGTNNSINVQMPPNPDKTPYNGPGANLYLGFPASSNPTCPVALNANAIGLEGPGDMYTQMYNQKPLYDYLTAVAAKKAADKKALEESNAPKL